MFVFFNELFFTNFDELLLICIKKGHHLIINTCYEKDYIINVDKDSIQVE
jgi:hypothetical protein